MKRLILVLFGMLLFQGSVLAKAIGGEKESCPDHPTQCRCVYQTGELQAGSAVVTERGKWNQNVAGDQEPCPDSIANAVQMHRVRVLGPRTGVGNEPQMEAWIIQSTPYEMCAMLNRSYVAEVNTGCFIRGTAITWSTPDHKKDCSKWVEWLEKAGVGITPK